LLIAPRNVAALVDACLQLGDDPARCVEFGVAARRRAEERFDVRIVNAEIMEALGA
jgi:glycosyltransferase involved in cell wall biosynthesis